MAVAGVCELCSLCAIVMSLVSMHVIVAFSSTTLKEFLMERRKTMGYHLIFCCDKLTFGIF